MNISKEEIFDVSTDAASQIACEVCNIPWVAQTLKTLDDRSSLFGAIQGIADRIISNPGAVGEPPPGQAAGTRLGAHVDTTPGSPAADYSALCERLSRAVIKGQSPVSCEGRLMASAASAIRDLKARLAEARENEGFAIERLAARITDYEEWRTATIAELNAAHSERDALQAQLAKAREALFNGRTKLATYVGVFKDDKELTRRLDEWDAALASLDAEPDYRAINLYRDSLDEPANNPCRLSTDAAGVAGEILSMLGLSQSDSFEPGEDYRRDMIADLIAAAIDKDLAALRERAEKMAEALEKARKAIDGFSWTGKLTAEIDAALAAWNAPSQSETTATSAFDNGDWFWDADDPDISDENPYNVLFEQPFGVIVHVKASAFVGSKYGFLLDALPDAETSDPREFWFDTKEEAETKRAAIKGASVKQL